MTKLLHTLTVAICSIPYNLVLESIVKPLQLVKIVDDLKLSMTTDQFSVLALLDFNKAFDSINHQLLNEKLICLDLRVVPLV